MELEVVQNLGIVATGTAAAGLILRYGIQRVAGIVEQGIEQSSEVVVHGIERFSEAIEHGIEQFIDKEIARHEAQLEDRRGVSPRLHEERAGVIIELYRRFVRFERDMRALTNGRSSDSSTDDLLRQATASGNEFGTYYMENKIYFPPDTCEAVERVQDAMNDVFDDFHAGTTHGDRPEQPADVESSLASWRDVSEDEVPELKRELETHFRELLGVDLE